jgi:SEC-C motif
MTDVPGRNDPCWCGSGKKYKKCHYLIKEFSNPTNEPPFWMQLRVLEGELQASVKEYYQVEWGGDLILAAQKAFGGGKEQFSKGEQDNFLCNWAMSPWIPDSATGQTLSLMFLDDNKDTIHPLGQKLILALNERPFSFIQIREVDPGVSILLRDLLTGEEWKVWEQGGSIAESVGRILYARVVTLDDTSIMMGCAPYPFDPSFTSDIQGLREHIKPKGKIGLPDLFTEEETIRDVYLQLRDIHLHPKPPKMCNTDGDPLEFQTLQWELINTVEEAVDALMPLTVDTRDRVFATAKRHKGELKWVEVHWSKVGNKSHKGMKNTLLGRLVIEPDRITAEVNSQKRATKLKKEIEKRLGAGATFERATIESFEAKMKEMKAKGPSAPIPMDLVEKAAIEEALMAMHKKHWDSWIDQEIPALGGLTPRIAATHKEGRELVEALLFSFEEGNRKTDKPSLVVPVEEIRKRLKL